jgi:hypothetical protein
MYTSAHPYYIHKNKGPVLMRQPTAEAAFTLQPTATAGPVITRPTITILQNPNTQGSLHGRMPGLFSGTPNSTNTGKGPIVTIGTINQMLHADTVKDLFTAILIELEIKPYMEIWKEIGIYNLETMNDFIKRPSTMYSTIIFALSKVSPSFPDIPYYYIQVEEDIEKMVTDLKYLKEYVQMKCQCSLMEMA